MDGNGRVVFHLFQDMKVDSGMGFSVFLLSATRAHSCDGITKMPWDGEMVGRHSKKKAKLGTEY